MNLPQSGKKGCCEKCRVLIGNSGHPVVGGFGVICDKSDCTCHSLSRVKKDGIACCDECGKYEYHSDDFYCSNYSCKCHSPVSPSREEVNPTNSGPMDRCGWCGMTHAEHEVSRAKDAAVPRVPCGLLVSGFLPKKDSSPSQEGQGKILATLLDDFKNGTGTRGSVEMFVALALSQARASTLKEVGEIRCQDCKTKMAML